MQSNDIIKIVLVVLAIILITGCSNQNIKYKRDSLQLHIQNLEKEFPLLLTEHCYFNEEGEFLTVTCSDNNSRSSESIDYKDEKIITIKYCDKYGCDYQNWSNPETLISPIAKTSALKIYTSGEYEYFHTSCNKYSSNNLGGKTLIVSKNDYESLFTLNLDNCKNVLDYDQGTCASCVAINNHNLNICEKIEGKVMYSASNRDICLRHAAPYFGKLDNCNLINDKIQKAWCILELAEKQNNISLCNELPIKDEGNDVNFGIYREFCVDRVLT